MVFHEHIIRVASPGEMTREAIWRELVRYAREPQYYVDGIVSAEIRDEEASENGVVSFLRSTVFETGGCFEERVVLRYLESVLARFSGNANCPSSSFLIRIEEPEQGSLFLRFVYEQESDHPALKTQPQLAGLMKQAYEAKDKDIVRRMLKKIMKA